MHSNVDMEKRKTKIKENMDKIRNKIVVMS